MTVRPLLLPALLACLWSAGCSRAERKVTCPSSAEVDCYGTCSTLATDRNNCGACGRACAVGETCSAGTCTCTRTDCDGACVDVRSDPSHCGACATSCAPDLLCTTPPAGATVCASACTAGQTACSRGCVDLESDAWNCGACGSVCGSGERCQAGRCTADLYLACYNTGDVREATRDLVAAGSRLAIAPGPIALAWSGQDLFVAAAQPGGAATVARIDRNPRASVTRVWTDSATPDVQYLAEHDGYLYVAHNSLGTLLVLSPSGAKVEEHAFVPADQPNPNPLGIAFAGGRAYVTLQARDELAVLDISQVGTCATPHSCIQEVARVDLHALASSGAEAMPARVAIVGGRAYVTLWNLEPAPSFSPPPGSSGRLAVVDLATNTLDAAANPAAPGLVDLGTSCLDVADLAFLGSTLYVTCGAFDYSAYPQVKIVGQGIAQVDVSGTVPSVGPLLAAPADAAPGELAFCSGSSYVGDRNTGRVFRLDPAAGAVDGAELCPTSSSGFAYVADIACGY